MSSIWHESQKLPHFDALAADIKTDVLIIGGGMAGLLTAYQLMKEGVDSVLVEADRIACGVTGNTTAKLTSQHGMIYHKLVQRFGKDRARLYLEANEQAIQEYRRLARDINCDFEQRDSFVYSLADQQKAQDEFAALRLLHYPATLASDLPLPISVAGAIRFPNQAQFHPLKFLSSIIDGLRIYEHTKVRELAPNLALSDRGRIYANKIIIATHFPILNKHGFYYLKMYQHRSYVLALRGAAPIDAMYVDESGNGLSFRGYQDYLLLGGGSHRTGMQGGSYRELELFAKTHYPNASVCYRFATQDCMTLDGMPYIGRYARGTENLFVATGFNKWGMTSSMVAARLLTDLVMNRENPYTELFSPSRSILRPQLAVNLGHTLVNFLTLGKKRCPHLGCTLKYNRAEHSWDCPCHGSRFSEEGKLLDNPATDDLPT